MIGRSSPWKKVSVACSCTKWLATYLTESDAELIIFTVCWTSNSLQWKVEVSISSYMLCPQSSSVILLRRGREVEMFIVEGLIDVGVSFHHVVQLLLRFSETSSYGQENIIVHQYCLNPSFLKHRASSGGCRQTQQCVSLRTWKRNLLTQFWFLNRCLQKYNRVNLTNLALENVKLAIFYLLHFHIGL